MEEKELSKEELLTLKFGMFKACFETAKQVSRPDEYQVKMNNLILTLADYIHETISQVKEVKNEDN